MAYKIPFFFSFQQNKKYDVDKVDEECFQFFFPCKPYYGNYIPLKESLEREFAGTPMLPHISLGTQDEMVSLAWFSIGNVN